MISEMKWFERKFVFDLPMSAYPAVLERLRGTPARLEEFLLSIPIRIYPIRIGEGWSIQEHVGHLKDLDELHDGRIDDYLAGTKVLRVADLGNRKTYDAKYNEKRMENILATFRAKRQHFVIRLEEIPEDVLGRVSVHPRMQQDMRLIDMAYFVAEHDDHHLACMRAISSQLLS